VIPHVGLLILGWLAALINGVDAIILWRQRRWIGGAQRTLGAIVYAAVSIVFTNRALTGGWAPAELEGPVIMQIAAACLFLVGASDALTRWQHK
jgi:hypothetical protein